MNLEIPPRSLRCSSHGGPLIRGSTVVSTLSFKRDRPQRCDFCEECWKKREKKEEFFWERKIPLRKKEGKEEFFDLFLELYERKEEKHKNLLFLFALLLERNKELSRKSLVSDASLLLIHPASQREFVIEKREAFPLETLKELAVFLDHGSSTGI